MKASLSWLSEYVDIQMPIDALADMLTMVGLEVEALFDRFDYLKTVNVAKVVAVDPHPDADKLKCCRVSTGDREFNVVCGAPNVAVGLVAPLALVGTVFPDGSRLQKSVIRGQASEGMLCSEIELGLGTDADGLMGLDPGLSLGQSLNSALALSDHVLDISLTPNRPDCLSIIGVAREIAAHQGTPLKRPQITLPAETGDVNDFAAVHVQAPDHCPRYTARMLDGIQVGPSPFWLQDRLMSVGLRPINNLVDITNFVMMESGQPLHAFDYDQLSRHEIIVRTAGEGERFTTLDQKERRLSADMLMICDGEKPVGVAGVMGGLNSEITETTTNVLIEAAYFDPISIRRTAKRLGLATDASHRFERGVDPDGTLWALNRSAVLMAELGGGRMIGGTIDTQTAPPDRPVLTLNVDAANRRLGTALDRDQMTRLLTAIEFDVSADGDNDLVVRPPSFRVDVSRPEDLTEEIARLDGYNRIPTTFPAMPAKGRLPDRHQAIRRLIKQLMVGMGFNETINYSFIHADSCDRLRIPDNDPRRRLVHLLNPISEDQAVMRTSLVPGLLETLQRNLARQARTLKLFEIGKIFVSEQGDRQPDESEWLSGIWTGGRHAESWHDMSSPCDFFDIKGSVEALLSGLSICRATFGQLPDDRCTFTQPGASAQIEVNGRSLGVVGQLHPRVQATYGIKQPVFVFDLALDLLVAEAPEVNLNQPLPRFPAISRDATIIVDKTVETQKILDHILEMGDELIDDLLLFDVFDGQPIPQGRKSISFRVIYRAADRTLLDEQINQRHKQMTDRLLAGFNASLPA